MNAIRIYKIVVVAVLLGVDSVSPGAGDTWTQKADMPTARLGLATSVVDGKIFAIGGYARAGASGMRTVEEYDPATDTWTTKSNMPTGRHWLSASAVNGKIYAIGGSPIDYTGLSVVEEYDPVTDTWTQKADMPTARLDIGTSVVDGIIYAIGGTAGRGGQPLRTVEAYDPLTDTWTTKADMHAGRYFPSTGVVDGKIYAIGGAGVTANVVFSTVEEYDPATDTWTIIANMPEPRFNLATTVVNGRIYAFGGRNGNYISSTAEEFDPATNTWTRKSDLPEPRAGAGSSEVNGKIYVIGGTSVASVHPGLTTVYKYDPAFLFVDFNGDGFVDGKDVLIMTAHWGEDYPLCDIGPTPFGDGVVDVQDVIVLAEHIGKEVDDPTLLAHWAFDETEGPVAYDSAGQRDATVIGVPQWQPAGGAVDGALEFDGATFVAAGSVLNPSDGPFSVFAWVNGGAGGQAIISQVGDANWLMADASGVLMTELKSSGRLATPLSSDTVITDGNWHRLGFTWDGSTRSLHVDDVLVAQDTDTGLADCYEGLNIGCGKTPAPDTFFSGLIDDVRIYNRAVRP